MIRCLKFDKVSIAILKKPKVPKFKFLSKSSPAGLREKLFWREYDMARGILDDTYGKQDMYR